MAVTRLIPTASVLGSTALSSLAALPAGAAELAVKLQLPEIPTAEYQRPYLAVWIEKADDTFVSTLSLWHRIKDKRGNELPNGDRYLNTLRNWWKQSGTTSQMPIDGLSSATRAPGEHELVFTQGNAPLNNLAPGKYQLVLEVAREIKTPRPPGAPAAGMVPRPEGAEGGPATSGPPAGGEPAAGATGMSARGPSKDSLEVVRVNFNWPVKKETSIKSSGKTEIGDIAVTLKP